MQDTKVCDTAAPYTYPEMEDVDIDEPWEGERTPSSLSEESVGSKDQIPSNSTITVVSFLPKDV